MQQCFLRYIRHRTLAPTREWRNNANINHQRNHEQEKFSFQITQRHRNDVLDDRFSSIIYVAPLSQQIDGSYLLFDGCMESSCVCGWMDAAEGAAFLFSYLYLATAMARRDNAFSISINSAWQPTSSSSTDGFGRAKFKYLFGVQHLQCSCGVVRNWKIIIWLWQRILSSSSVVTKSVKRGLTTYIFVDTGCIYKTFGINVW